MARCIVIPPTMFQKAKRVISVPMMYSKTSILNTHWKISKNGNSGVMFLVQESPKYDAPYLTGPEMQVLDNDGHPMVKF